jgi:23S rRNA pseudouridine1911/1915/1917 synthase
VAGPSIVSERGRRALTVPAGEARARVDAWVTASLRAEGVVVTRESVKRWLEAGLVTTGGRPLAPNDKTREGMVIDVELGAPPPLTEATPDPSIELAVVYEDAHLLVVDKPAGLVVHPARGHADGTLVNALLGRGGFEVAADQRDPGGHLRPGIVHRLDKDTSGLLVVARDERTREGLKALFATHDLEREYAAIVVGAARDATFRSLHGRDPRSRLRFTTRVREGKLAVTHVTVTRALGVATLLSCRLETGRTHQIRVHLAELAGTPLLGDALYGPPPRDPRVRTLGEGLGRHALHARTLGFVHPITGERLRFESPLPHALVAALEALAALGPPGQGR